MEPLGREEVKSIIGSTKCSKDFNCLKSGFSDIRPVEDIGLPCYVKCLECELGSCDFAVQFGGSVFCKCPVRVHIAKEFGM